MVCPNCGVEQPENNRFCTQCGFDLQGVRRQQTLLETDPALVELNQKYARHGVWRLISGAALAISLVLVHQWLEGNISDAFGDLGLLLFLPSLVIFIVACALRGATKGRIRRALQDCTGPEAPPAQEREPWQ